MPSKSQTPQLHIPPTPERARRGPIELVPKAIADEHGNPSQPYRSIDLLAALARRGAISDEMCEAGEDFQRDFRKAHLAQLRASDWSRPLGLKSLNIEPFSVEAARTRIWKAATALGGVFSLSTSVVWAVIGWEVTLKSWAFEQGRNQHEARGILLGALDVLAYHYGKRR